MTHGEESKLLTFKRAKQHVDTPRNNHMMMIGARRPCLIRENTALMHNMSTQSTT